MSCVVFKVCAELLCRLPKVLACRSSTQVGTSFFSLDDLTTRQLYLVQERRGMGLGPDWGLDLARLGLAATITVIVNAAIPK